MLALSQVRIKSVHTCPGYGCGRTHTHACMDTKTETKSISPHFWPTPTGVNKLVKKRKQSVDERIPGTLDGSRWWNLWSQLNWISCWIIEIQLYFGGNDTAGWFSRIKYFNFFHSNIFFFSQYHCIWFAIWAFCKID